MSHLFFLRRCRLELAQALLRVVLAWHIVGSSTPKDLWVNYVVELTTSQASMFSFGLQHLARYQSCLINALVLETPLGLISQCSVHNAPIFRLLLQVAVNGTHQCESLMFLRNILSQSPSSHRLHSCRCASQAKCKGPMLRVSDCGL
jgi:hypothetical protein